MRENNALGIQLRDIAELLGGAPDDAEQLAKDAIEDAIATLGFGSVVGGRTAACTRLKESRAIQADQKFGRHVHPNGNADILACLDLAIEALE